MSAGRYCSRTVVTAWPEESVRVAAQRMADDDVGTLVVIRADGGGEPAGIVTDRDITVRCVAAGLNPDTTPVSRVMTQPLRTIDENTPIEHAVLRMGEAATRRLVVVGNGGHMVGVLSLDDVLDLLVEEVGPIGRLLRQQQPHVPA